MRDIEYWIWLSSLEGLSSKKAFSLLEKYKSPEIIYGLSENDLKNTKGLTEKNIKELLNSDKRHRVGAIYEVMMRTNIKMVNIFEEVYPQKLKNIYDPPIALYYKGKLESDSFSIAVVGSRRPTVYGTKTAGRLSYDLSMRGVTIVSGLARGIDSIAHKGCLDAGGRTIAVLGSGLDIIYPQENIGLFNDIIASKGLVISEYPPGMPPLQHNFPARNRIISGISGGVLVIEAAKRSGSLITAGFALEQGKEVFAVPGNIDCAYSMGTNQLIKEGAKLVLNASDILEEFEYSGVQNFTFFHEDTLSKTSKKYLNLFKGLTTDEIKILKIILNGVHNIDEIIETSNISAKDANNILFMLEMKGIISQNPGKIFEVII
ncbi:DNA-processing protein DprA [Ruminiclostridium josui]|uniref:DNA-processing protein DprA n=1 Tax=Ruminiclostridium josui TaxID=1499 RepID=UPI000463D0F3|nr:DNA-processing protein DprA [Ruminiclostridium josui]